MARTKAIILGAAGRDFHNFNVLYRDNPAYEVVAFTATQIPYISNRIYPPGLAGKLYPKGVQIYPEEELPKLIKRLKADEVVFSYSDVTHDYVMERASVASANGANFRLLGAEKTMLKSSKPVVAICAVRTGCGKSQTTRYVADLLKGLKLRVVAIRHPMPYGDLAKQAVERFATLKDLDRYKTTIEEREEYEPHILNRTIVYAGVDYERILREAEKEADVILWDGGNNDTPFIKPDLMITVADPLRAGNELTYYPGDTSARIADILLVNKINSATKAEIERVTEDLRGLSPRAKILYAESIVKPDNPRMIKGKRVLVVEDGPTITHGGMRIGAAMVAAKEYGAAKIVRAKDYAVGSIKETFDRYKTLDLELPAMGYSRKQLEDLKNTINMSECDVVVSATPSDLRRLIVIDKPIVHVGYELAPKGREFDNAVIKFGKSVK
ncbi:MAG: GTPase [Candidatus Micrarchaeota archaeon]|nr:GTPase [Candidatus Micrarchaeota archaeon]